MELYERLLRRIEVTERLLPKMELYERLLRRIEVTEKLLPRLEVNERLEGLDPHLDPL